MLHAGTGPKEAASRLIDSLLAAILDKTPEASVTDLNVIDDRHRRIDSNLLRYSLSNSVVRPTLWTPLMPRNRPLADWGEASSSLLAGGCRVLGLQDFRASPLRDRFCTFGVSRVLICPVIGAEAGLLGAVFTMWRHDNSPSQAATPALTVLGMRVAGQIAAVLDLCDHALHP